MGQGHRELDNLLGMSVSILAYEEPELSRLPISEILKFRY
jgi:hypothetical protein